MCEEIQWDWTHSNGVQPKIFVKRYRYFDITKWVKANENKDLKNDRKIALENSIKFHEYNKNLFNKNRRNYEFNVGDLAYVENGNRLNRKKLDELRIGPYKILQKMSNSIYKIDTGHKKSESNLFHITKLIPALISTDEEDVGGTPV